MVVLWQTVDDCLIRCRDDLKALTRFVTWDLHERSAGALQRSLPDRSVIYTYHQGMQPPLWTSRVFSVD